jgi:hypothetical protein
MFDRVLFTRIMWFERIPQWLKIAFVVAGYLVSAFSGRLPEGWQDIGLWAGIVVGTVALMGLVLHSIVQWRGEKRVTPVDLIILGLGGMILFGCLTLGGVVWQARSPALPLSELNEMKVGITDLKAAFDKYVKPRDITEQQFDALVAYLLPRDHHSLRIIFAAPDDEAAHYADRLARAIRKGGWDVPGLVSQDKPMAPGLTIQTWFAPNDRVAGKAAELLQEALAEAQIPITGTGSGGGVNESVVELRIGPRQRGPESKN